MQVKVYATLRLKVGQPTIDVKSGPGDTVRDIVCELLKQYPVLGPHVMSKEEELVDHVNVFLNGRNIRLLDGLDTVIQEGQKLDIFPPIGGGRDSARQQFSVWGVIASPGRFSRGEAISTVAQRLLYLPCGRHGRRKKRSSQ